MIGEVGRGGMGVVYKARELKLNRIVALKMILGGPYSSADQMARFRTETQAVAQLQHPNIVQIYEVGEFEGRPYCAFEFVGGGSLARKAFRNPLPSRDAAGLVETLALAIHSAHQSGIVHRDLKPDNILLTVESCDQAHPGAIGIPKVSDFGLAKRLEADTGQTQTGSILGTPSYMAPEQAQGKTRNAGPAADIWALGAVLYYLLTGQPPFQGATMLDTLEQVRTQNPVAPSRVRPKLPRDLETICLKCLEKEPRSRYPTARALADDLHRFLANEPIRARPVGMVEHALRSLKRRPTTAALIGLLVVVMALLAGSLTWLWRTEAARQAVRRNNKPFELVVPRGLPSPGIPADNPLSEGRVDLGKQLFFDKRLSADGTVSCAVCHDPSKGWSGPRATARGVGGRISSRKAPTIVNVAYQHFLFWDGRAGSLEEQAPAPIQAADEMAMPSLHELEARLNRIRGYQEQFRQVFGTEVTAENVGRALAAYQRTILSGDAPYDRHKAGEEGAMSERALRGMKLFFHKAHCSACHSGPNFSDGAFHNIGIGLQGKDFDPGREKVSGLLGDRGSFRTPSLRDSVRTAPYMHDGSLKTLEEVIEHYDRGGGPNPQLDEEIFPLKLTAQEKRDLVAFLREGLSGSAYPYASPPKLPD
jgi:cytochrome c peroxidase